MNKKSSILAVIPARGGSKAIPRKNIVSMCGQPMLYYMLTSALKSKLLDVVAVSSEDDEILKVAKDCSQGHPKLVLVNRPAELAQDDTPTLPVVQHALQELEKDNKTKFDYVVLLHANSPLTDTEDIDKAVEKLIKTGADSVVSVYEVPGGYHPKKMKKIDKDRLCQYVESMPETDYTRQSFDSIYKRSGGIYAVKRYVVTDGYSKLGFFCGEVTRPYVMPAKKAIDIDDIYDFKMAKILMKEKNKNNEK